MIIESNTDVAAALSSLHCSVVPEKAKDVASDCQKVHFLLGVTYQKPDSPKKFPVPPLRRALRENTLSPDHPVARQLLAAENRKAVVDFLKRPHVGIRITPRDNGFAILNESGIGLPGKAAIAHTGAVVYKTHSLRTVVSLMTAGHALLWVEGPDDRREFYLDAQGAEGTAMDLMHAWKTAPKSLPSDSGFLLSMAFMTNRDILMRYVSELTGRLILRKPNTTRQITIPETASGKTWDKARRFLIG